MQLTGVTRSFGAVVAVDDVSFRVSRGEFVTLLGPSGCGKTSTLRLIAGFLAPGEGQILLEGEVVNDVPPYERDIGMVFQSYALFPHMTVGENVGFGLRMRRVPRGEAGERIAGALALVKLGGLEGRYPHELSGGQQQRVAIARGAGDRAGDPADGRADVEPRRPPARRDAARAEADSSSGSGSPPSTSPTTRKKRWRCRTASS